MNVLDLFSGIGGFSLGLERAGMRTVAFCEIERYPRAVLKKHWPDVPCYDDIRTLSAERLRTDGIAVDVICGGFPCQDISTAGKGAGIDGSRSGLWSEYARLISEVRPRYVIVENVSALLSRGLDRVLSDLAAIGYDAEWHCIPACAAGAPHIRDRVWIVAYPGSAERGALGGSRQRLAWADSLSQWQEGSGGPEPSRETLADPQSERCGEGGQLCERSEEWPAGRSEILADTHPDIYAGELVRRTDPSQTRGSEGGNARKGQAPHRERIRPELGTGREICADTDSEGLPASGPQPYGADGQHGWRVPSSSRWWSSEPDVGRVAHGVPSRVDRLRGLGNAVVPQIPEIIGRAILAAEAERT